MKATLVAPFLLPRRAVLTKSLDSGDRWDVDNIDRAALMIDRHRGVEAMRLAQQREVGRISLPSGQEAQVFLGAVSIGTCVIEVDVETQAELHRVEEALLDELRPLIRAKALEFSAQLDPATSESRGNSPADLPHSRLLWWHRVLVNPDPAVEPRATRIFGTPFELSEGCFGRLGSGFTALTGATDSDLEDVLAAILSANEEWLLVDEMNRRLGKEIVVLGSPSGSALDAALDSALRLEAEAALAVLMIDERRRLLAPAELRVYRAAVANWESGEERETMLTRAAHIQTLLRLAGARHTALRDERRNRLVWAITVITLMQITLAIIDFSVAESMEIISNLRLAIAVVTAVVGGVLLGAAWVSTHPRLRMRQISQER